MSSLTMHISLNFWTALISVVLGLSITTTALGQTETPENILIEARKEVAILTSNKLAGRGYTYDGHLKAARYIARRFSEMGLKSFPQFEEAHLQAFPLKINVIEHAKLRIDGRTYELGKDFIPGANCPSTKGSAYLQDAGYGLTLDGLSEKNALFFKDGLPPEIQNDPVQKEKYKEFAGLAGKMKKLLMADPRMLVALKNKLTHSFAEEQAKVPYVEFLGQQMPDNPQMIYWDIEANVKALQSNNVLGWVEGTEYRDKYLVVSAHYDHLGRIDDALFAGANDNASGIAMLLGLAQHYAKNPSPYSILFIAFGGEETGLNGSRFYVEQQPLVPLQDIQFILNLDLMGTGEEGIMAVGGTDFPEEFQKLNNANNSLKAVSTVKQRRNAPNSDHYYFLSRGVKGFFIYTLGGPPWYHDVFDVEENLELSRFVNIRNLFIKFLDSI